MDYNYNKVRSFRNQPRWSKRGTEKAQYIQAHAIHNEYSEFHQERVAS